MDWPRIVPFAVVGAVVALTGCGPAPSERAEARDSAEPTRLRVQLDLPPQIEAGGYYQAKERGFYRAQGLEVEILAGGPGVAARENVAAGRAELGVSDGSCLIVAASRGMPLVIVGADMQRNPLALMYHRTHPLRGFRDLDGRTLIANAGMAWVDYLQRSQRVSFALMPGTGDLASFVADETLVRQCLVTQEPFLAEQMGAKVGTLMIADADYDPYRVIYTTQGFARQHPDVVRRFLSATIAGYNDLLESDPAPAFAAIRAANPAMTTELMQHSLEQLRALRLVQGRADEGERTGRIIHERIARQLEQLQEVGQRARPLTVEAVARFDLLPVAGLSPPSTHRNR